SVPHRLDLDAAELVDLQQTTATHLDLGDAQRERVERGMVELVERLGGTFPLRQLAVLAVAERQGAVAPSYARARETNTRASRVWAAESAFLADTGPATFSVISVRPRRTKTMSVRRRASRPSAWTLTTARKRALYADKRGNGSFANEINFAFEPRPLAIV